MKTAVVILGILAGLAAGILSFYGLFAPVNIQEKEMGPFEFVMRKEIVAYKDVGSLMDEMTKDIKDSGIETSRGVCIFYDKPKLKSENKSKCILGRVLDDMDSSRVMEIGRNYKVGELPQTNYIVVEFPYKGLPSVVIGIYRVYPKIAKYMRLHDIPDMPIVEIYEPKEQKILYIVPLDSNRRFFDYLMDRLDDQG